MSPFFAYLARMKHILRWGLMRNARGENVQEHSMQVAWVAHALAVIENRYFGGDYDAEHVMALAAYHEAGEVFTGDLPTPIKYYNPDIRQAYQRVEQVAEQRMLDMLPEVMRSDYDALIHQDRAAPEHQLVKAADRICAYLKCVEEGQAGNREFDRARQEIAEDLAARPEKSIAYFMEHFVPSFSLSLDQLREQE